jgi:hypothetical protein
MLTDSFIVHEAMNMSLDRRHQQECLKSKRVPKVPQMENDLQRNDSAHSRSPSNTKDELRVDAAPLTRPRSISKPTKPILHGMKSNLSGSSHSLNAGKSTPGTPSAKRHIRLANDHAKPRFQDITNDDDDDSDDSDDEDTPESKPEIANDLESIVVIVPLNDQPNDTIDRANSKQHLEVSKRSVSHSSMQPQEDANPIDSAEPRESNGSREEHYAGRKSVTSHHTIDRKSFASSGNSSGVFGSHPVTRFYYHVKYFIIEKYYDNITFRKECILLLLALFPYGVIAAIIQYMDRTTIYEYYLSVAFKVAFILVGMLAEKSVAIVNRRHSDLTAIISIIGNEASPELVIGASNSERVNKFLKYLALAFNALLIASELSIDPIPVLTPYGTGGMIHMVPDLSRVAIPNDTETFDLALGSTYSCHGCAGFVSEHSTMVPLSSFIKALDEEDTTLRSIFNYQTQDIVGIETRCSTIQNPPHHSNENLLRLDINKIVWGQYASVVEVTVLSRRNSKTEGKRCRSVFRDRRANVAYQYGVVKGKYLKKNKVLSMEPEDSETCLEYESVCVNFSERRDLSYTLLKSALTRSFYDVDLSSRFPDPKDFGDEDFEHEFQEFLAVLLINSATRFMENTETSSELFTDSKASKFRIAPALNFTILGLGCACIGISILLIVFDLIQLGKVPDRLLRKLHSVIRPGKAHLSGLAVYAGSHMNGNTYIDDWIQHDIRFGEDRTTVGEEMGRLRFGAKKEIVRYKDSRLYYD